MIVSASPSFCECVCMPLLPLHNFHSNKSPIFPITLNLCPHTRNRTHTHSHISVRASFLFTFGIYSPLFFLSQRDMSDVDRILEIALTHSLTHFQTFILVHISAICSATFYVCLSVCALFFFSCTWSWCCTVFRCKNVKREKKNTQRRNMFSVRRIYILSIFVA